MQLLFRFIVVIVWGFSFVFIVCFVGYYRLGNKNWNILATAFIAANVVWVVGLEITVRSKRSGKFLFRTYV